MRLFSKKPKETKQSKVGKLISIAKVGQPVWTTRDYESFAKEGYNRNVIAYRCITMIAQSVGSVGWLAFADKRKIENHPVIDLLNRPNQMQSKCEFFEAMTAFLLISGNSYVESAYPGDRTQYRNQPPVWLYTLRPDRMKVIAGATGMPLAYRYEVGGQRVDFPLTRGGLSNVLHIRSFNPSCDWYGHADTESAAYSIDQHNASAAWNQALLQNSASPSGIVSADTVLDEQQFNSLKEMIDDRYGSPTNAGKPMLLEGGLKWTPTGTSPKDMDWLEGRREAAREIALAFGVPPMLLGIPGDNTYSNQREARLALWEETILPILNKISDGLNNWLTPRYGQENLRITYDLEGISALRYKQILLRDSLQSVTFMTENEKRELMGLSPKEGGDELYQDSNKVPLGYSPDVQVSAADALAKAYKDIGFSDAEIKALINEEDKG